MSDEVRFFTSADSRFFLGVTAMVESLRLSGNTAPAFVVDDGLRPEERQRLMATADVLTPPPELDDLHPWMMKATADLFWSSGVVVLLDSDMIVTSPLDDLIEQAKAGRIAVHPDHNITRDRQFAEWATTFELRAPLRPQRYIHSVPFAISLERWPHFFERWRWACRRLPPDWPSQGFRGPYGLGDQDALNALLMSEVPAEEIWIGSESRTVHADALGDVEIVDVRALACRYRGAAPVVLHYGLNPKAWERRGWRRVRANDAYVRLLRRLLFAPDVRVPIEPHEVPVWIRPRGVGRMAALLVGLANFVRVDLRHSAHVLANLLFRHV
jgi:hypothetical protein